MVKKIKGGDGGLLNYLNNNEDFEYDEDMFKQKFIVGMYLILVVVISILNIIVMIFASLKDYSSFVNTLLVVCSVFVILFSILSLMLVTNNNKNIDTLVLYSGSVLFIFVSGIITLIYSLIPNARLTTSFYVSTILETFLICFIACMFLYSIPKYLDGAVVLLLSTCTLILTLISYMNNIFIKSSDTDTGTPSTSYV
jgi:hypothetical protein